MRSESTKGPVLSQPKERWSGVLLMAVGWQRSPLVRGRALFFSLLKDEAVSSSSGFLLSTTQQIIQGVLCTSFTHIFYY